MDNIRFTFLADFFIRVSNKISSNRNRYMSTTLVDSISKQNNFPVLKHDIVNIEIPK